MEKLERITSSRQLYAVVKELNIADGGTLVVKYLPKTADDVIGVHKLSKELYEERNISIVDARGRLLHDVSSKALRYISELEDDHYIIRIQIVYKTINGVATKYVNDKAMISKIITLKEIILQDTVEESREMYAYDHPSISLRSGEFKWYSYIRKDDRGNEVPYEDIKTEYDTVPEYKYVIETARPEWINPYYTCNDNGIGTKYCQCFKYYLNDLAKIRFIGDVKTLAKKVYVKQYPDDTLINVCKVFGIKADDYSLNKVYSMLEFMLEHVDDFVDRLLSLNSLKDLYAVMPRYLVINNKVFTVKDSIKKVIIDMYESGLYPLDDVVDMTFNVKTESADYSNVIDDEYNIYICDSESEDD